MVRMQSRFIYISYSKYASHCFWLLFLSLCMTNTITINAYYIDLIWRTNFHSGSDSDECTALCTIFTILLTLWNSEQKNELLINLFNFHLILMKLGEVVVIHVYYNFTRFHQNRMKNKKVLLIARFSAQNFKVSVESWKSYIVTYLKSKNQCVLKLFLLHFAGLFVRKNFKNILILVWFEV